MDGTFRGVALRMEYEDALKRNRWRRFFGLPEESLERYRSVQEFLAKPYEERVRRDTSFDQDDVDEWFSQLTEEQKQKIREKRELVEKQKREGTYSNGWNLDHDDDYVAWDSQLTQEQRRKIREKRELVEKQIREGTYSNGWNLGGNDDYELTEEKKRIIKEKQELYRKHRPTREELKAANGKLIPTPDGKDYYWNFSFWHENDEEEK